MKLIDFNFSYNNSISGVIGMCLLSGCIFHPSGAKFEKISPEEQWKKANIHSYEFLLRVNCFCSPETTGPHRILVRADTLFSVNGIPYGRIKIDGRFLTVPDLFLFIKESNARNPFRKTVLYDSAYGFPTSIYFDFDKQIADEEIGYLITEFRKN
jgi:hypothetical protein